MLIINILYAVNCSRCDLCCNERILEIWNIIFMQWCTGNGVGKSMETRLQVTRDVKGKWPAQNLNTKWVARNTRLRVRRKREGRALEDVCM